MIKQDMNVAVVGLGYVGLPLALLAARKGFSLTGIEVNTEKVDLIRNKKSPFQDENVQKEIETTTLEVTTDFEAVKKADIVIICVPTPVDCNKMPDYTPVESSCELIGPYLHEGQLVILESTVNPGVCEEIIVPILERVSGLKVGGGLSLAHCPERINPGDAKWNVSNIPRVVGGFDAESCDRATTFYMAIVEATIKPMGSLKEAEAVKVVENSFRNVNIAFVNELARSFAKLDIDVVNVIDGAATKPFAFMAHYPSLGIGGHCIPVDPYYLIEYSKKTSGFEHDFLSLACKTNEEMHEYTVSLVQEQLNKKSKALNGSRVAVLGLAYKKDIDDCRESPAFEVIKLLEEKGAIVISYDPHVLSKSTVKTLDEALTNADAVLVATNHTVFSSLKGADFARFNIDTIIDGKNCLDKKDVVMSGISYIGIGR
ncbi:MAG: nucleotide sugar dehydrogenase [Candidatus Nomurabacteria bacterium]|nr:nucleotide sugar dehydrogenase [Candidatus Nomurabacteria bacterium]